MPLRVSGAAMPRSPAEPSAAEPLAPLEEPLSAEPQAGAEENNPRRARGALGRWNWVGALLGGAAAFGFGGHGLGSSPEAAATGPAPGAAPAAEPRGSWRVPGWPLGTWGNWNAGPQRLPEWLEGLRAAKDASSPEALLTPLPTFRSVPKGAAPALGDLFADLAEQICT